MLRTKLFMAFAILVLIGAFLSAFVSIRMIRTRVLHEAQTRVDLDLGSAWEVTRFKQSEIETILRMVAGKKLLADACSTKTWENEDVRNRLEIVRTSFKLDFLTLVDTAGKVVLRAAPPHATGELLASDPAISRALHGETVRGMKLFSQTELTREADGLAEKALLTLEETRYARPKAKTEENRGLAMICAAPVMDGTQIVGVIYGGVLLNRNHELIDRIKEIVFRNEEYQNHPTGTATLFLDDCRIATTVRLPNGNRALGTRASKEVSDRVLDNDKSWVGRAFVVSDWYLTAYDPIHDINGNVAGMLYVGLLEKPFTDVGRSMILRYAGLLALGLVAALLAAYIMATRLSAPIHKLVEATTAVHRGQRPGPLPAQASCVEVESLVVAFNEMMKTLADREDSLKNANDQLAKTNETLSATNRSYMETLGFVSHELKNPLSTMLNYTYLLKRSLIGPVTEKQQKAVVVIESNIKRLVEMVRHYLNLARIENGDLQPVIATINLHEDVLQPLLINMEPDITGHGMQLINQIPTMEIKGDTNMIREVFENLVSNAIKYGRMDTPITLTSASLNGFIQFTVRNEGEGIPADKVGALFGKFSRLNNHNTRRQKGTGLGLFITKTIVEAHGGYIEVESVPNAWTEFRFTIPA
jgi:two-component system NtrC family sensor kinase